MIEPIFGFIGTLGLIVSLLIIGGILAVFATMATLLFIRKVEPGYIGVRVGFLGYVISDTWIVGIPLLTTYKKMDISVKKLDIERKGHDGLICEDNIRADIEVTCFTAEGVEAIRYCLIDGLKLGTDEMPIKIELIAPPLYVMLTTSLEKDPGIELLQQAIEHCKAKIEARGGQLTVKVQPRATSQREELELDQLMEKMMLENQERDGDTPDDE